MASMGLTGGRALTTDPRHSLRMLGLRKILGLRKTLGR
jgi:hypothetical protein